MLRALVTNEQLRALIAVAEQGSFRKAAKTIYKTQAAISASIKSLENEFDIVLFDRNQYRPTLTDVGQAFYRRAKLTMEHFVQLQTMGRELANNVEPTFGIVIGLVAHFLYYSNN